MSMTDNDDRPLTGQCVAVPESRQLDLLVDLLESRGASAVRLPLISILDAPDPRPVEFWLREFIRVRQDYFIILTGEGLRRLQGFAQRAGCDGDFIRALRGTITLCRGPKPGRVLREMGLKPDLLGEEATTPGIIKTLDGLDIEGKRVAVQLYGEEPNRLLMDYLQKRGALTLAVAPYVYAPQTDEQKVADFILSLGHGPITAMMFTSQPQYSRLLQVARKRGIETQLRQGLAAIRVIAVGPLVAEQLRRDEVQVEVMPESSWFMKPMVMALVRALREGQQQPLLRQGSRDAGSDAQL